jgi:uncharacterized protein
MADTSQVNSDLIEVRRSKVHGLGVFAAQKITKGTRIIEYVGEHVSHDEADRRYEDKDANDSHTFLFIVDSKTVIDAGVDGNDARFFNHSCDPNCESVVEERRVFIEAIRDVEAGGELTYDYQIQREDDDPDNIDEVFACRCGFPQCRGTMLWPTQRKPKRKKAGKSAAAKKKSAAAKKQVGAAKKRPGAVGKQARTSKQQPAAKTSAAAKKKSPLKRSTASKGSAGSKASAGRRSAAAKRSAPAKRSGRRR